MAVIAYIYVVFYHCERLLIKCCIIISMLSTTQWNAAAQYISPDSNHIKDLNTLAFKAANNEPRKGIDLAWQAANIALRDKDDVAYGDCINTIGWAYVVLGKKDSAKLWLGKAKKIYLNKHLALNASRAMGNLATVYQSEGNTTAALQEMLAVAGMTHNTVEQALAERMIGIIYRDLGDMAHARSYFFKAINGFKALKNDGYLADAMSSLGILYDKQGSDDSALFCYRQALPIFLQQRNLVGAAYVYDDIAIIFFNRNDKDSARWIDSAEYYFNKAYKIYAAMNNTAGIYHEQAMLGHVLYRKKKYAQAERAVLLSLPWLLEQNEPESIKNTYFLLSDIYIAINDHKKAFHWLERGKLLNDSLNAAEKKKIVADMLSKYETDKKDQTIRLLNTQNDYLKARKRIAEQDLGRTREIELFAAILVVLFGVLGVVLMNRYRIKQRLQATEMRNRISNDLHDDVGSSLSSILLLSKLAADDEAHRQELVQRISVISEEAIGSISDIIWSTDPRFDTGGDLRSKIMNYTAFLQQMHNIVANISIDDSIKELKLPMEIRKNLFLIVKETVNNALKHAAATEINVTMSAANGKIVLEVADNGKGYGNDATVSGHGTHTMQARAVACGGELSVESTMGIGTKIIAWVPVP